MTQKKASEIDENKPRKLHSNLSRRKFLKDAGLIAGGASMATVSPIAAAAPGATGAATTPDSMAADEDRVATGSQKIKLNVNGADYEVQVDPEESLRDCLRERLGYLSIKDMCLGYGACGSCTVIVDGRPILSCLTLAVECDGRKKSESHRGRHSGSAGRQFVPLCHIYSPYPGCAASSPRTEGGVSRCPYILL
jgi:ferredoxin